MAKEVIKLVTSMVTQTRAWPSKPACPKAPHAAPILTGSGGSRSGGSRGHSRSCW
jgi:hypothetical protein